MRSESIIRFIKDKEECINLAEKGKIEISFSGDALIMSLTEYERSKENKQIVVEREV